MPHSVSARSQSKKIRLTPLIGVGLGMLVAGSLVLLSLLAQRVILQAPSSPSLSPVYPWRQPEASVELDRPGPRPGSLAALERTGGVLRRLRGQQPNRLLALVAEAQAEAAQVSGTSASAGAGVVVAFADQGAGSGGIVTEAAPTRGAIPDRSRGRDAGTGGSDPPVSGSDGDDNDSARRREDEDEEEPPDDVEIDDDRDQYAQGSEDSDSGEGSAGVVVARNLAGEGDSDGSGSDS